MNKFVTAMLAILLFVGCTDSSAFPRNYKEQVSIIIVGDSIMHHAFETDGTVNSVGTTATALSNKDINVVNVSRGGQTLLAATDKRLDGAINYLTWDGTNKHKTVIWLEVGVNDYHWNSTPAATDIALKKLTLRIKRGDHIEVYCPLPLLNKSDLTHRQNGKGYVLEQFRDVIREVAALGLCTLVDTTTWFDAGDIYNPEIMPDGLHLSTLGHERYTQYLLETIK